MDSIVETRDVDGLTVNVRYDHTPTESPRDWSPLGTFFGFHNRYQSPDPAPDSDPQEARRIAESPDNICLQVWLYDHSGTAYRATVNGNPFHCPWDSGLFGFIYVSKAAIRKEYGCKRVSGAIRRKVIEVLQSEVETYSQWANGQVFGFEVLDSDGEQLDSCWGYIGEPDYAMQEGVESAAHHAACIRKDIAT